MRPTEHVLDSAAVAVPGDTEPVPGGRDDSVRAGDLVLSPGRDASTRDALSPRIARLAVDLDTRRGRDHRDLRIAMPVPARDGSWVVDGWAATRFEPGAVPLTDLVATRAVGAVLHAELARHVPDPVLPHREDRSGWAERAGTELLDPRGAPVVIDITPSRRPVLWAEAVLVLDSVLWHAACARALTPLLAGLGA